VSELSGTGQDWTEPGAYLVAPDVWRIPAVLPLDGLRAVNIYVLTDAGGLTLIDGGWALDAARRALVDGLAQIGAGLGDIKRFLVTHAHRDHYTNAIAVRREFGTPVLLGAGERATIDRLTGPNPAKFSDQLVSLTRNGAASVVEALTELGSGNGGGAQGFERPDEWIADRVVFQVGRRTLEAIATPGHTRGHLVFADRAAGVLFAGDHVLPHITPSVAFEVAPSRLGLRDYLESLRLVRALPDMELLPAHGPTGTRVHARVDALLAHHDRRLADMADALAAGASTGFDVANQIGWTRRLRKFADLDPFNQMLAVFETVLHLELLVAQGHATVGEIDGIRTYAAVGSGPYPN
jgi:glyoxylase-like metal-dependent hydrolase (beta-lactamase superfamily II)